MKLIVLNHRGRFKRTLPVEEAKTLAWNEFCSDAQTVLKSLKRQNDRVRCPCRVVMHVVRNPDTGVCFLRRNPGQTYFHARDCGFWAPEGPKTEQPTHSRGITKTTTYKYLLNTRVAVADGCLPPAARKTGNKTAAEEASQIKYLPMFSFLYTMLSELGVNRYPNRVLNRNITWEDVHNFLQRTPYKDLFWCPSRNCSGGAVGLNQKILKNWKDPKRVGQGLLLGIIDEIPNGAFEIRKYYQDKYPIKCQVASSQISVIGTSGPYFMLAVCTANTEGRPQFATPTVNRMILQSIKSWSSWIPVDTDVHRKIIAMLFQKKSPFEKPMFPKGLNMDIKPDFVIEDCCSVDLYGAHPHKVLERFFKLPVASCNLHIDATGNGIIETISSMMDHPRVAF